MYKGLIYFLPLLSMKNLKSCLPKESLLDTTISLTSTSVIKIGLLC